MIAQAKPSHTLPKIHEKDKAREMTGSNRLDPTTETYEGAQLSMDEQTEANATHAFFCEVESSS